MLLRLLKALFVVIGIPAAIYLTILAFYFPYNYDGPLTKEEIERTQKYYAEAYKREPAAKTKAEVEYQTEYERVAKEAAEDVGVTKNIEAFVEQYKLKDKAVLDIGSGRGYLQDVVEDYTGLDISPSVRHYYKKKFVVGSATSMPFPDDSFDAAWSIWVFEHVPNPEQAFAEARRVVKSRGLLYLMPAWDCVSWAADGYEVRPYSDFNVFGKLVKASIPLRKSYTFKAITQIPVRVLRQGLADLNPTTLRYRRLKPNYEKYWIADADAVNSIDIHEALIWFLSRGDECLNCEGNPIFTEFQRPLIIRVNK